jgi:4-hydroxy-tetrahydrodipicolinate reductase
MKIKVAISGATGSVGKALIVAVLKSDDFILTAAVARKAAGQKLSTAIGVSGSDLQIVATVDEALQTNPQVLIDYTHPTAIYDHCLSAIRKKVHVVVGTSGLTKEKLEELGKIAEENGVGVFAAGNFSITAALLQHLAIIAAKHLPSWEIIDYGKPKYIQAPSATGRELADKMAQVHPPEAIVPPEQALGLKEARGATHAGTQMHSVRSPGFGFSLEAIFGLPSERLTLRHDASESAEPYVYGTLLAAKNVVTFTGLKRGVESLLF